MSLLYPDAAAAVRASMATDKDKILSGSVPVPEGTTHVAIARTNPQDLTEVTLVASGPSLEPHGYHWGMRKWFKMQLRETGKVIMPV